MWGVCVCAVTSTTTPTPHTHVCKLAIRERERERERGQGTSPCCCCCCCWVVVVVECILTKRSTTLFSCRSLSSALEYRSSLGSCVSVAAKLAESAAWRTTATRASSLTICIDRMGPKLPTSGFFFTSTR